MISKLRGGFCFNKTGFDEFGRGRGRGRGLTAVAVGGVGAVVDRGAGRRGRFPKGKLPEQEIARAYDVADHIIAMLTVMIKGLEDKS